MADDFKIRRQDESRFRRQVIKNLNPYCHVGAIENGASWPGTPDINGCLAGKDFWLELKIVDKLKNEIKIPHYTKVQKNWMQQRIEKGGICYLFIKSRNPKRYLLFYPTLNDVLPIEQALLSSSKFPDLISSGLLVGENI